MNEDFLDLLAALEDCRARFLVVGAHAMAVHGVPRATGDLDIWVEPNPENAAKVWRALLVFGAPVDAFGWRQSDLERPGIVFQVGQPPRRIDILTQISGVAFTEAWPHRVEKKLAIGPVPFLGLDHLIRNKRASARPKDLVDLDQLETL